jgi:hypothetical protein
LSLTLGTLGAQGEPVYDESGHLIGHTVDAPRYWGTAPDGTALYLKDGSLEGLGPGIWIGNLDRNDNGSVTALVRNLSVNQTYAYTWTITQGRYSDRYTLTVTNPDGTGVTLAYSRRNAPLNRTTYLRDSINESSPQNKPQNDETNNDDNDGSRSVRAGD